MGKNRSSVSAKNAIKVTPVLEKIQQHGRDALYQVNRSKKHQRQLARNIKRLSHQQPVQSSAIQLPDLQNISETEKIVAAYTLPPQQSPQQPKNEVEEVPYLSAEHRKEADVKLEYSAKELKTLYGWDKAPNIAAQNKAGGQCGFQAHTSLMWSITSIGPTHQFGKVPFIRSKMVASVNSINQQMLRGDIPTDRWNSQHLYAGDDKLHEFSVHAFLHFGGCLNPCRYRTMVTKGGSCLGLHWLLKQSSGYFIVYGNRHDLQDVGTKKFQDSFHYLAVNIEKQVVIDNKSSKGFLRLCKEAFAARMKTVYTILRFEKLEGGVWKVFF